MDVEALAIKLHREYFEGKNYKSYRWEDLSNRSRGKWRQRAHRILSTKVKT